MSGEGEQNLDLTETKNAKNRVYHVVFMHSKFKQEYDDFYLMNLAHLLDKFGHQVTIYTSAFSEEDSAIQNSFKKRLQIKFSGSWIPNSIFGMFRKGLERFRSVWMALSLILFSPKPNPKVVIVDADALALPVLSWLGGRKTIYVHHFPELQNSEFFHCSMHVAPNVFTVRCLSYADDIIVQTKPLLDVFRRSYPKCNLDPTIILPPYDTGLWLNDTIDIRRLIPDLPKHCNLFVAFGEYKKRTNFNLILDTLEHLFAFPENPIKDKIHIVLAGYYNESAPSAKHYYSDLVDRIKAKPYAAQVTFLKQLPVIYEKTLIKECTAVIHPTRHDLYPGPILAAMSLGKPVITVNCGFSTDVIMHRLTGIVVEPDPLKFANVMVKLAGNKNLQRFLGDMSHSHFCSTYSFDRLAAKLNKLILDVLDSELDFLK